MARLTMQHKWYRNVKCIYCDKKTKAVKGEVLYGTKHKLSNKEFYYCEPCQAWVGMHENTNKPLGTPAKADLRKKRLTAHSVFDKIWRDDNFLNEGISKQRKLAYQWLAKNLDIDQHNCHIGNFDIDQCNKTIYMCLKERERDGFIQLKKHLIDMSRDHYESSPCISDNMGIGE